MNVSEYLQTLDNVLHHNGNEWNNYLKVIEELSELTEALTKKLTKANSPKEPTDEHVIEEIGDVQLRLDLLKQMYGIKLVNERVDFKAKKLASYISNPSFEGRII